MNIFYLDPDPEVAVRYHCDQHVWKMPLEYVQILCTALHRYGLEAPYKPTHAKHPSVLWAGDNLAQWQWLRDFAGLLFAEYADLKRKAVAEELELKALPASA